MAEDADKTLEKIRALLARAVHPTTPSEEARTSAHLAVRLIVSNDFTIGANGHARSAPPPPPPPPPPEPKRSRSSGSSYAVLSSKYDGRCVACAKPYAVGDRITWRRGEGATHYACRAFWDDVD